MAVKIIDTTLRDGEQKAGIVFKTLDKLKIATFLAELGIHQIEAGTPAMGGEEQESIKKIVNLGLTSKISAWNRLNINDIKKSIECGVDIIHISIPASELQMKNKLKKDPNWVKEMTKKCINFAKEKGFTVHVGMEDASRADIRFLIELCQLALQQGAEMVRYADTVGILNPKRTLSEIKEIGSMVKINLGFHGHNDLGMAVANSIAAALGGASYIDCTLGGIGERAGNCDYFDLLEASRGIIKIVGEKNADRFEFFEENILKIVNPRQKQKLRQ